MELRGTCLVVLFICLECTSGLVTKHVDVAGNDATGDGTSGSPYKTIAKVFAEVTASTALRIELSAGVHYPDGPIDVTNRTDLTIVGAGSSPCLTAQGSPINWMTLSAYSWVTPMSCSSTSTYISGSQNATYNGHRIFYTNPSAAYPSVNLDFTLQDLSLWRGHAHTFGDHYGGCIRLWGDNIALNFDRVIFQDCHAAGPRPGYPYGGVADGQHGGEGGAMYLMGSNVVATLNSCKFYSCMTGGQPNGLGVPRGGAIVFGTTSSAYGQGAWKATGARGNAEITLNDCSAMFNWAGAFSTSSYGGFMYSLNMELPFVVKITINGGTYSQNAAFMGSMIKVRGITPSVLSIDGATVTNNGWKTAPNGPLCMEGTVSYDMNPNSNIACPCNAGPSCGAALTVGVLGYGCQWTQILVKNSMFVGNAAISGGGLYMGGQSHSKVEGNIFRMNYATRGGGIVAGDKLPVFMKYTAETWAFGGGVQNTVKNNVFDQNYVTGTGGGMYALANYLSFFSGNNWTGNVACFPVVNGLVVPDAAMTTACTGIAGALDTSSYPISAAFDVMPTSKTLFWHGMSGDRFEGNIANGVIATGGAIRFMSTANLPVSQSQFIRNRATLGAAVATPPSGGCKFTDTTFQENYTPYGAVKFSMGGAVWAFQMVNTLLFERCKFIGNSAGRFGGAVRTEAKALVKFEFCEFDYNSVNASGGAIYHAISKADTWTQLESCKFRHNRAYGAGMALDGGGVFNLDPGALVEDTNGYYLNNSAVLAVGGALFMQQESKLTLRDTVMDQNKVDYYPGGAAIYMDSGSVLDMHSVTLESNEAAQKPALLPVDAALPTPCVLPEAPAKVGGSGAHIYAKWRRAAPSCDAGADTVVPVLGTKITMDNCTMQTGISVAGGIYCDQCDLKIKNSRLTNNKADQFGGAAYITKGEDTKFSMENTTCDNNEAEIGGCIYFENRTLTKIAGHSVRDSGWTQSTGFPDCTFYSNTATGYGPDYASDINEMVPIYQVTFRANQSVVDCNTETGECESVSYPPGTVAPYDDKAKPVYIKTAPIATDEQMSLLNVQSNTSFTVGYRPGVAFNLYVQLRDYFTQIATSDLTGSGVVMQLVPDMTRQPGLKAASVSSAGLCNISRVYMGGSAEDGFNTYDWHVDSAWFRLTEGVVGKEVFTFEMKSNAALCLEGEKTTYDQDPVLIALAKERSEDYLLQKVIKRCTWCKPGTYEVDTPVTACKDCPKAGADCLGGGKYIKPKGNYWRHYAKDNIYKCRYKGACLGAPKVDAAVVPTPCKEGYTGPLCAVCADGYANTGAFCAKCPESGVNITNQFILFCLALLVTLIVVGTFLLKKMFGPPEEKSKISSTKMLKILMKKKKTIARLIAIQDQVKILIAYFQVVICIVMGGSAPFPTNFGALMNSFEIVNIDIVTMFKSMCVFKCSFYTIWIYNFSMPIVVSLLTMLYTFLTRPDPEDESMEARTHYAFCYKVLLMLYFTVYPNCSRIMLGFFNCHAIQWDDDTVKHFLKADYSLECYEGEWMYYMPWGVLGVLLYPLGIPLLFYGILRPYDRNRELDNGGQTLQTPEVYDKLDFLYCRFVPECWWYETSECVRKMIVGILFPMFAMPGTATNTLVLLLTNLVYICMMMIFWPYKKHDDNMLFSIQLIAIELTLFGTLILNGDIDGQDMYADGVTTGILLGTTCVLIILYLVLLLRYQLSFVCTFGFPLVGLQCVTDSKLNCFKGPGGTCSPHLLPWGDNDASAKQAADPNTPEAFPGVQAKPVSTAAAFDKGELDDGVGLEMNPMFNDSKPTPAYAQPDEDEMDEDELDELIETYFHRYDLDESGTINSNEELQQLTTNLAFKLRLGLTGTEIDETVGGVGTLDDSNGQTLNVFTEWFKDHFLDFEDSDEN